MRGLFGEVNLHARGASFQAFTYVLFRFPDKILQESLARIIGYLYPEEEQTQRRRGNHRLLQWPMCVPLSRL